MFKPFRNPKLAKGVSLLLAASFTVVSCAKDDVSTIRLKDNASSLSKAVDSYSGEELFRGIFLLEGEVTAKLPVLEGLRLVLEKEYSRNPTFFQSRKQSNQRIVDAVHQANPLYFTSLKEAVDSQQFDRISSSLQEGAGLIKNAISTSPAEKSRVSSATALVNSIDRSKFDFSKKEDVEAYLSLVQAKIGEAKKTELSTSEASRDKSSTDWPSQVYAWDVAIALEIAGIAVVVVAVAAIVVLAVVFDGAKSETNALEYQTLVKDIAFNLE